MTFDWDSEIFDELLTYDLADEDKDTITSAAVRYIVSAERRARIDEQIAMNVFDQFGYENQSVESIAAIGSSSLMKAIFEVCGRRFDFSYLHRDDVNFYLLPRIDPNAFHCQISDGSRIISINYGLIELLSFISDFTALIMLLRDEIKPNHIYSDVTQSLTAAFCTTISYFFITKNINLLYSLHEVVPETLRDRHIQFHNLMLYDAISFVLCHEAGHGILGHGGKGAIVSEEMAINSDQERELAADIKAIELGNYGDAAALGAGIFFAALSINEIRNGISTSHPPSKERIDAIKLAYKNAGRTRESEHIEMFSLSEAFRESWLATSFMANTPNFSRKASEMVSEQINAFTINSLSIRVAGAISLAKAETNL